MNVYDIPNIEHCAVTPKANGGMFLIVAHEGWCIHLNDGNEDTANIYKGAVGLLASSDFSLVQIVPIENIPEGSELV